MVEEKISAADVRRFYNYDAETGVFTWRERPWRSRAVVGSVAGNAHSEGYVALKLFGVQMLAHRVAWLWVTGTWPTGQVDHENHRRSDNRWLNLRDGDQCANMANLRGPSIRSTTGLFGVSYEPLFFRNPWRYVRTVRGKVIREKYPTLLDAACAVFRTRGYNVKTDGGSGEIRTLGADCAARRLSKPLV